MNTAQQVIDAGQQPFSVQAKVRLKAIFSQNTSRTLGKVAGVALTIQGAKPLSPALVSQSSHVQGNHQQALEHLVTLIDNSDIA